MNRNFKNTPKSIKVLSGQFTPGELTTKQRQPKIMAILNISPPLSHKANKSNLFLEKKSTQVSPLTPATRLGKMEFVPIKRSTFDYNRYSPMISLEKVSNTKKINKNSIQLSPLNVQIKKSHSQAPLQMIHRQQHIILN